MKEFVMYKFRSMQVNAPDMRNEDGTEEPLIKNNAKVIEAEKRFLNKEV